ncbi:MAG: hypothetical protein KDI66_20135 [Xanthomonadales bacterium]|nr:hypothetical protein [Xanthomonadales bacterium]
MGLTVSIGDYAAMLRECDDVSWYDEQLQLLNEVLLENGKPAHIEPTDVPEIEYKSCVGFPYSFLHYLRRVYARLKLGKPAKPVGGDDISKEDEADIDKVFSRGDSHLLYHSDCDGFYVPLDFPRPIEDDRVLGGSIGSTPGLLRELVEIAPLIDVVVVGDSPTDEALSELDAFDESHPYHIERVTWYCLYENCVLSLKHKCVISFG